MHWLFIHKIQFSSTCFEPQVLIFMRIQLYTSSIWYCHSLWEFLVACRYTAWVRTDCWGRLLVGVLRHPPTTFPLLSILTKAVYRQVTTNSHRGWQYHMLHVYSCILLKMSTWGSKHVEENSILWINNNQCIKVGSYYIVNSCCTVRKTSSYVPSEQSYRLLCVCVCSWSLVRGGHDPESGRSPKLKVLRLYGTRVNVISFSLFITYYVCSRMTTYCYYCYRMSKKFYVHMSVMR